jgi:subtilisin family serine protease
MKRTALPILSALALLASASSTSSQASPDAKISPRLAAELSALPPGMTRPAWVYLTDKGFDSPSLLRTALRESRRAFHPRCLARRAKNRAPEDLVDFKDIPAFPPYSERVTAGVPRVRAVSRWLNALSVEASAADIAALAALPFVRRLEPVAAFERRPEPAPGDQIGDASSPPGALLDLLYGRSRGQLEQINVPALHLEGYSGRGVTVCLLDSGFRTSHPAFAAARLVGQWDFVNGDGDVAQDLNDPQDYSDSHGTGTWSVLGGFKPGQIIGPAFGADFILGKTETDRFERPVEEDYWVAGLEWAESLGADVVSSSLGYIDWYDFRDMDGKTAVTTLAADRAADLGVVVVNAAGNERNDPWGRIIAPADGFKVIAVGAVNSRGEIASFSSPGPTYDGRIKPEVCAQGVDVWLASASGTNMSYRTGSGTSFAAPLAAGVAALLLEAHPDWTPADVRRALTATASRAANPDNDYGWGIVNALSAVNAEVPARRELGGSPPGK